jgi:hypothetical protein
MPYLRQKVTFYLSLKARRIKPLWSKRPWHVTHGYDTATREALPVSSCRRVIISKETKCRCRESDSSVVPMKLGNVDGGKATTKLSSLLRTHLLHTAVEIINESKTIKDSRISKI